MSVPEAYFAVSAAMVFGIGLGFFMMGLMQPMPRWFGPLMFIVLTGISFCVRQYGPALLIGGQP